MKYKKYYLFEKTLCEYYENGYNQKETAKEFGIAINTCKKILIQNDIFIRNKARKTSKKVQDEICELFLDGNSASKVADELNIDRGTVIKYLKKNGITRKRLRKNRVLMYINRDRLSNLSMEISVVDGNYIIKIFDDIAKEEKIIKLKELVYFIKIGFKLFDNLVFQKFFIEYCYEIEEVIKFHYEKHYKP